MLPAILAITHTLTTYYIFSGLAVKGLMSEKTPETWTVINDKSQGSVAT